MLAALAFLFTAIETRGRTIEELDAALTGLGPARNRKDSGAVASEEKERHMIETSNLSLDQTAMQGAAMTPEERKKMWRCISDITEEEFDAMQAERKARQTRVPQPGVIAPDFELDVVISTRKPTGQKVRLSALRGRPVGLVFGSYT